MDHLRSQEDGARENGRRIPRDVFFIETNASDVRRGFDQLSVHFFLIQLYGVDRSSLTSPLYVGRGAKVELCGVATTGHRE